MTSPADLAAHLCSRLCHDLLSPVGAIGNGLELLAGETDPELRADCIGLLETSAQASAAKLKFFRIAFGAGGAFGDAIAAAELRDLCEALVANDDRLAVEWAVDAETLPVPAAKILLNLVAIAIAALPRGGTLAVGAETGGPGSQTELVVRAQGPRIAFDSEIGRALEEGLEADELSSRNAPACMIRLLAIEHGGGVQHLLTEDALLLGALLGAPERAG